jgi:hypothetical protein
MAKKNEVAKDPEPISEESKAKQMYELVAWVPRAKGRDLYRRCGTGFKNGKAGINISLDFDLRRGDRLTLFEIEEAEAEAEA